MAETVTFTSLTKSIAAGNIAPVYLLHGEEGYYLDRLAEQFEQLLPPADRDFGLVTIYAPQAEPAAIVDACQSYNMMVDRQIVLVKEAHAVKGTDLNALASYVANPNPSTVLVIISRGKLPACAQLTKAVAAAKGINFESKKLRENMVGSVIRDFVNEKGLHIEEKALAMLQDYVGTDLSRIYNEIDKMTVVLGPGAMITPESIEQNIGISKDYNNFEFVAALARRNAPKCYRIVDYFRRNPKNNPVQMVLSSVFSLFSNTLLALYAPDKSDRALLQLFGFKWPVQLNDIKEAMRRYNAWQLLHIISDIRQCDTAAKGIGSRTDSYDLLLQLTFTILNTTGRD